MKNITITLPDDIRLKTRVLAAESEGKISLNQPIRLFTEEESRLACGLSKLNEV